MPWSARFVDPIILPDGREFETLRDAATYITELPQAERDAKEWQTAMEALLLVAERDGPEMMARIGMMQALNRHSAKAEPAPRRRNTHPFETLEAGPPFHLHRVGEWTTMASISPHYPQRDGSLLIAALDSGSGCRIGQRRCSFLVTGQQQQIEKADRRHRSPHLRRFLL